MLAGVVDAGRRNIEGSFIFGPYALQKTRLASEFLTLPAFG
jgi:hypothetical protein